MSTLHRCGIALGLVTLVTATGAQQPSSQWTVDAAPILTLGESAADTTDMFTLVVGATRMPDGRVLVGDLGDYALLMFSADGKLVRRFGRKGSGPGEVGYLARLLRCGDSVVTMDIDGNRASVFSLGGDYARVFRFASPQGARPPYRSVCNAEGDFAHYGWEVLTQAKGGAYRPNVPLWLTRADAGAGRTLATIPGSERFGYVVDGQLRSSRPMPLGKQTAIALGKDRVYVAAGDRYEIAVYDFAGKALASVREARPAQPTTKADIDYLKARDFATLPPARRAAAERDLDTLPLPRTLPAFSDLRVDTRGHVWAQDYPRSSSATTTWTVYDRTGRRVAVVALPKHLEVYEIGADYVLGRYLDPEEEVPLVRVYRLRRGT